jgi:hypothetical protein
MIVQFNKLINKPIANSSLRLSVANVDDCNSVFGVKEFVVFEVRAEEYIRASCDGVWEQK